VSGVTGRSAETKPARRAVSPPPSRRADVLSHAIIPAKLIWMNGELVPWDDARVHVLTHGLHYGTGVFEGIRSYSTRDGPAVFRLDDHLVRLAASARILLMSLPYELDELRVAVHALIAENGLTECYIRPIAFHAFAEMSINPVGGVDLAIAAWPHPLSHPADVRHRGLRTMISSWRRHDPNILPPQAKSTGGYLAASLARMEARRSGFDDALLLSAAGNVSELATANVFAAFDGALVTPPLVDGPLPGITRKTVFQLATDMGIEYEERSLTRSELVTASEVFVVSTAAEVVGIREIDGCQFESPGPLTRAFQDAYATVTSGRDERYATMLDFVAAAVS
jgi:branched-chain amino acid aminotransferase